MRLPRIRLRRAAKPDIHLRPASTTGPRAHRWVVVAGAIVAALGLSAGLGLRLTGQASNESPSPAELPSLLQTTSSLVVFSEFGEWADTLWAANPDDPSDRIQLGLVEHAWGYAISPSLSPDGAYIAYTVLPRQARLSSLGAGAELWVLETETGATSRLATDVDLAGTPVWSPTSDAVVVRRSDGREGSSGRAQLLRIDLTGETATLAAADAALYAIDFSPDGSWLYYAQLSPDGTDLARAPSGGGQAETLAHLSDGFTRDWRLSPDGTRLAYLAQTPEGGDIGFAARVLTLATGNVQALPGGTAAAQFSPVWEWNGALTIGQLQEGASAPLRLSTDGAAVGAASARPGLPAPDTGFDVPLSWSPDGAHLAVRSFAGASTADPGPSRVVIVGTDGERHELSRLSDVAVAGWLQRSA